MTPNDPITEEFLALRARYIRSCYPRLNDRQFEAVTTVKGPLLVLAGAGSGKTTVIINRIAYLIRFGNAYRENKVRRPVTEHDLEVMRSLVSGEVNDIGSVSDILSYDDVRPWRIMAITFTNKAAAELKNRLSAMLGEETGDSVWAATFHSACVRILRKFSDYTGFSSNFTIYNTDDQKRVVRDCLSQLGYDEKLLPVKSVMYEISSAKDKLLSPEMYSRSIARDERLTRIARVYALYQKKLRAADAMDFDDIIFYTVDLLKEHNDVASFYNEKYTYIMVDEYQDTNIAQFELTRLLAGNSRNICVVGDDDQSIYKFRGATIENILQFEDHYPSAVTVRLEENYRSTGNILEAANKVIAHNTERKGKNLWTSQGDGSKVVVYTSYDESGEADFTAREIRKLMTSENRKYSDFAILYRVNAQSATFEKAFVKNGIPYRIIGGHRFYDRKEIRDAVAYLSVVVNPGDEVRLMRIINEPKRGIGQTTLNNASQIAAALGISLFEVISDARNYPELSRGAQKLMSFAAMIEDFGRRLGSVPMNELFMDLMKESGYLDYLAEDEATYKDRFENINELQANMIRYMSENPDSGILDFLEEIALMSDIDNYNAESDTVVLMTLHSAKGLEFPVCFLPGMEEGVFPSMQSAFSEEEIEEERRLAYVGITRAREKLYLLNSKSRILYGSTKYNMPSRFLEEIPESVVENRTPSTSPYGATVARKSYHFGDDVAASYPSGNSMKPAPRNPVPQDGRTDFKTGDTVVHKKFGRGVVLSAVPVGADVLVEVAFEAAGTKKLMAKMAKMEKI